MTVLGPIAPGPDGGDDTARRIHLLVDGGCAAATVTLDDEAVRIARDGEADRIVPVRRIDRVTCRGDVALSARALVALAGAGAPVGLLRRDGRLAAVMIPRRGVGSSLADALEHAAAFPDLAGRLEDWRRSEAARHARRLRVAEPPAAARVGLPAAEAALAAALPLRPRARAERTARLAASFCGLLASRVLLDAGCPDRWLGAAGPGGTDLGALFGELALWRLAILASRGRSGAAVTAALADDARATGSAFGGLGYALHATAERAAPRLSRELTGDIRRLHLFLVELALARRFTGGDG